MPRSANVCPRNRVRYKAHHPEQRVQESFGLAQRKMVEESQGQGGFDGKIRVPPLPTPPAASAGRPGSDRFRGQPHRHIAAPNEGPIVGRPIRHPVLRLIRGMNLRLHPCSVAPAETRRAGQTAPPAEGLSCNNAPLKPGVAIIGGSIGPLWQCVCFSPSVRREAVAPLTAGLTATRVAPCRWPRYDPVLVKRPAVRRIENAVRQQIRPGATLYSEPGGAPFKVGALSDKALVLFLGQKETRTVISWSCLEGIYRFLDGEGWVKIGAVHDVRGQSGTLDGYIKRNGGPKRTTGGYVAAVLSVVGVIDVDRSNPARIRLKKDL